MEDAKEVGFRCDSARNASSSTRDLFDRRVYNVVTLNATVGNIVESIRRVVADIEIKLVDRES